MLAIRGSMCLPKRFLPFPRDVAIRNTAGRLHGTLAPALPHRDIVRRTLIRRRQGKDGVLHIRRAPLGICPHSNAPL